jgi:hypothetical protein
MPRRIPNDYGALRGTGSIIERPLLAARIGVVVALWNDIDASTGMAMANILGLETPLGIKMYLGIENPGARREMLRDMAASRLTDSDQAAMGALLDEMGKRAVERSTVVDGVWGIAADFPDELIWQDPRDTIQYGGERSASVAKRRQVTYPRDKVLLYAAKDFDLIEGRARRLRDWVQKFGTQMYHRYGVHSVNRTIEAYSG